MNPDTILTWHCLQGQGLAPGRAGPPVGARLVRLGLQVQPASHNQLLEWWCGR